MPFDDFKHILWVKSVSIDEGVCAYSADDVGARARVPKFRGDLFELHAAEEDGDSLQDPKVGDYIVLTQHDFVTHVVEVRAGKVEPRPKKSIRKNTWDERFMVQRTCALISLRRFDESPTIPAAFGFDPRATGGEVFGIGDFAEVSSGRHPLWLVQRRLAKAMLERRWVIKRP